MKDNIAIKVSSVSKSFRLPHEKTTSIKSIITHPFKRRSYEKQQVLKNIDFEIKKGEFFGIVGRNGSGKSTLLKLLAGIYSPDEGSIQINGKLTPFIELGVGFNPELTGRENVFLNGALLGFNRKEMMEMYDEIVEFAEIEKFMDQKLKNYSSGMQVRLAFSIAIRAKSDILLIDEVLAVGDAAFQQKCFDYFEELKAFKKTVVFVSHDMGSVRRFCNRAVYLQEGKIALIGTSDEVSDRYTESNIERAADKAKADKKLKSSGSYSISTKVKQNKKDIVLGVSFKAQAKEKLYVGLSISRDGVSIAEITTPLNKPLMGKGMVTYYLDTSIFNEGLYYIGAGLFKLGNREVVAIPNEREKFFVKGFDITKGASIKLPDTWEYLGE